MRNDTDYMESRLSQNLSQVEKSAVLDTQSKIRVVQETVGADTNAILSRIQVIEADLREIAGNVSQVERTGVYRHEDVARAIQTMSH
jgi:hypothetical protein